jgi:hypothetical protein
MIKDYINMDYKLNQFNIYVNNYMEIINNLLDISIKYNLLPFKVLIMVPFIKKFIIENRTDILEYGIKYLLNNKNDILNFSLDGLDQLDELSIDDSDDNVSRKSYINNISEIKNNFTNNNVINSSFMNENEILNIIIEIKNNSKKLKNVDIELISNYIKLLIIILEDIKLLFNS